ncbi:WDR53 [Branchiostoma lanceolatum]|uniref:WDR53 protein n=1 Tax=Branchiostoma lanceolatum TaxID=7740 RepID=A0A8J9ZTV3_BRALA|nr:WDR53 [Branchiostoma lanceolatum]
MQEQAMTQECRFTGGHQDSVLCLACSVDGVLASGGESGELCLWSVEKPGLLHQVSGLQDADVTSVCFSVKQPHVLCAAVGESVHLYDSRDMAKAVHQFKFNSEEINEVNFDEKENFLAACDDSGEVKIIDFEGRKLFKTLRGHENICSSAKFCPKKTWGMVSGGLDQNVILWDFSRGKKLKICNMQDFVSEDGPNYMHSTTWKKRALTADANGEDNLVLPPCAWKVCRCAYFIQGLMLQLEELHVHCNSTTWKKEAFTADADECYPSLQQNGPTDDVKTASRLCSQGVLACISGEYRIQ